MAKLIIDQIVFLKEINDSIYHDFLTVCMSSEAKNIVINEYKRFQNIRNLVGSELPHEILFSNLFNQNGDTVTISKILNKYKGKIIYLDIWSIDCGPCISEMPHSIKLKEKFKDKELVFIYFSVDRTDKIWKKGIEKIKIPKFHYRLDGGFNSTLLKVLGIKGVPHYILFDKEGKIADLTASRPSSGKIKTDIHALLQ
jgi:thiol-disulfide isomerase/thioredoxin